MLFALLFASCTSTQPAATPEPVPVVETKEALFQHGHRLYMVQSYDSALVVLQRAVAADSTYAEPIADLAALHYDLAMAEKSEKSPARISHLKNARRYFTRLEALGNADAATYERLCEIAVALNDDRTFLRYAKKNAERYPFDRQYYNLGLAYFNAGEYQSVVKTQKDAAEKFKQSPYLGGFYRQMGRAYMKLSWDQTAERTLEAGLKAVDARLAAVKKDRGNSSENYQRLSDDRIAILQLLRRLHQTYREDEKLKTVERLLRDAGALR